MILFWPRSIDRKSEVKVEKRHLLEELKLKMFDVQKATFFISTPPPRGAFEILLHFTYLWNMAQKSITQIFNTLSINKFHWNFAPCISGILNFFCTFSVPFFHCVSIYNCRRVTLKPEILWQCLIFKQVVLSTLRHRIWSSRPGEVVLIPIVVFGGNMENKAHTFSMSSESFMRLDHLPWKKWVRNIS